MDYKKTELWMKSLGDKSVDYLDLKVELENEYLKARSNALYLLDKIRNDFPNLTVHDVSHVDGLWQVASVITGDDYDINPLEGFILGCAFLMHDAVLSYDAVGGVKHLRELAEWKDYYEDFKDNKTKEENEILFDTDFITIRKLHAKYAEHLYNQLFERDDGSKFYIIDNKSLRDHYGELICKVAGSHHWEYDELEKMDTQMPASSHFPREWSINLLKLACILRCADAGHIDDGRAPDYLLRLLDINGVSKNHWIAQNRLSQIDNDRLNPDNVIIKSNITFKEEDFASWNVAFDAVQVLDRELKMSNALLKQNGIREFKAKRVSGASTREELCKYIKTEGWEPFDACVHVSEVERLIKNLGGEKLYGKANKLEIVLRELIQNSRDAICARQRMDSGYQNGSIQIEITNSDCGTWVKVSDNGIGMSIDTVKNYFLNFGNSFWSSDLSKKEFVGLNSSGFKSIGKFGIGFFSVFMVSSFVIVETRKYDAALNDNLKMKFPTGLCLRPIISHEKGEPDISTCVSFLINTSEAIWSDKFTIKPLVAGSFSFEVPYSSVLQRITSGLDVDVYYSAPNKNKVLIHKSIDTIQEETVELAEWLKDITYARYRKDASYLNYIDTNYKRLRKIVSDGKIRGLAGINTYWSDNTTFFDVSTVDGLSTISSSSDSGDFFGCLIHSPVTASRDRIEDDIDLVDWAKEQYSILYKNGLSESDKLHLPYVIGKYGINMTDVMNISVYKNSYTKVFKLKDLVLDFATNNKKLVIGLSIYSDNKRAEAYLDYNRSLSVLNNDEFLFAPIKNSGFLSVIENDSTFPFNILYCIRNVSEKVGVITSVHIAEKKAISIISGYCSGLIITFKKKISQFNIASTV